MHGSANRKPICVKFKSGRGTRAWIDFSCRGLIFVVSSTPRNPRKFIHHENFYAYGRLIAPVNQKLHVQKVENHKVIPLIIFTKLPELPYM